MSSESGILRIPNFTIMQDTNALKISREALQEVADFLPYPFIIAEDFGDIHLNTYLNVKFLEEIGYTLDEIPTIQTWYEHAYPDPAYREEVIRSWDSEEKKWPQRQQASVKRKSLVTCKNGSQRWYEIKASVINKIHVIAFVDLDNEIRLQEELKSINSNNDRMLSILGHDLRSPVANLMMISSMAANTDISSSEFVSLIHQINEQSAQVLELLDRTLTWAKLNFNSITQQNTQIDFNELIAHVLEVYKPTYEAKKIQLVMAVSDQAIASDIEIVKIIVRNILSNAIKFTPQNGTIHIEYADHILTISDTGIGMTPAMVADILNNNSASRRGTNNEIGIGMGMQLVKGLAEKINCNLRIESWPDKGTVIQLHFDDARL